MEPTGSVLEGEDAFENQFVSQAGDTNFDYPIFHLPLTRDGEGDLSVLVIKIARINSKLLVAVPELWRRTVARPAKGLLKAQLVDVGGALEDACEAEIPDLKLRVWLGYGRTGAVAQCGGASGRGGVRFLAHSLLGWDQSRDS